MTTKAQAKAAIYSRLANTPTYHPATVDLFEDFTLQGGDIVTVNSGNDSYNIPTFGMRLKWNGSTTVTAQSSGDETLEPLEVMAAKQSSRGGYGRGARQQQEMNDIHAYVLQQDDRIGLVVEGSGSLASIKAASIIASINADTGQSAVGINADKIIIGELNDEDLNTWASQAKAGTGTFAKFLTVRTLTTQELNTMLANIEDASIDSLTVGYITTQNGMTVNGTIQATNLDVSGNIYNGGEWTYNIYDAEVTNSGRTLVIHRLNGNDITFNKATSIDNLTGTWGGNALTVSTDPDSGKTYTVGFPSGSSYPYNQNIFIDWDSSRDLDTAGTNIVVPMKAVVRNSASGGTTVSPATYVSVSNALDNTYATSASAITANGVYEPVEGKVGFNKIVVDVQGATIDYRLFPNWDPNDTAHLTVERTTSQDYGTTYNLYVVPESPTLTYSSSTHKYSAVGYAKAGTSRSGATRRGAGSDPTVSGLEGYYDGKSSVTLEDPTWNAISGDIGTSRTVTVSTTGRTNASGTTDNLSKSVALSLNSSSGTIYLKHSGTNVAKISDGNLTAANIKNGVSIFGVSGTYVPSITVNTWNLSYQANTNYTYVATVKVNGTTYTSGNLSAANAYDNGWSGCYGTVGLDSTTATTLNYGQSVTVYAQAKQASGSPSKTNVASRTLTAPADNYTGGHDVVPYIGSTGTTSYSNRTTSITANGTYYAKAVGRSAAGAGYDTQVGGNNRTFTVNVSGPVSWGSISSHSSSQTGINKNYSASAGYHYFVMRFTIGGTTYKIQLHTTT